MYACHALLCLVVPCCALQYDLLHVYALVCLVVRMPCYGFCNMCMPCGALLRALQCLAVPCKWVATCVCLAMAFVTCVCLAMGFVTCVCLVMPCCALLCFPMGFVTCVCLAMGFLTCVCVCVCVCYALLCLVVPCCALQRD